MIGLVVQVRVPPERRLELIQFFETLKDSSRTIDADLEQHLFEDMVERDRLLLLLRFGSQGDLEAFRASERYRSFLGSIKVLGVLESLEHSESLTDWLAMHPASAGAP